MLAGARISDEELQTTMMIWHEADSESSARGVEDGVCPPRVRCHITARVETERVVWLAALSAGC